MSDKIIINGSPVFYASDVRIATDNTDNRWQESARSWEVSCEAIAPASVNEDALTRLLSQEPTMDVTIYRRYGKLPRKMKKAYNHTPFNKNTKWLRKLKCYEERRAITIRRCSVDMQPTADGIEATFVIQDENKQPL